MSPDRRAGSTGPRRPGRSSSLAAALLAAVLTAAGCTSSPSDQTSTSPTTTATLAPGPVTSPSASGEVEAPGPSDGPTQGGTSASPAPGSGTTPGVGSEGQPAPAPSGLFPVPDVRRLTGPMPDDATASGGVVPGFPTTIVPVVDGLTVVRSSVSSQGDRLQLGLTASSAASPEEVTALYVAALAAEGFQPGPSPAVDGSTATAFVRGSEGVVLTVRARVGGGTELSLSGTLVRVG